MTITMYASPAEIRSFAQTNNYSTTEVFLAQIYALYEVAGWTRAKIAELTGYAPSTVSSKRKAMWDYAELADLLFGEEEEMEEEEEAEELPTLYRHFKDGRPPVAIEFMPGCGENIKNAEAAYFFKFFNDNGLEFNKIGTSAKDVVGRLRDEIGDYSKKFDIRRVEVHRIVPCGDYPAEGAESELRAKLIYKYPKAFRKNDRFFGVDIAPEAFDEILNNYFV